MGAKDTSGRKILVTGAAGFIGYHLVRRLLREGYAVAGVDNLDAYYDPALKADRLREIGEGAFTFSRQDIVDSAGLRRVFEQAECERVIHLAAQVGVRHSFKDPVAYSRTNITGFVNVLECCKDFGVRRLVFASSSSVYGMNANLPFSVADTAVRPISLYGATKRANEMMAHAYASRYGIACSGIRFFTVYGPWGRPDMALYLFTQAIREGRNVKLFNGGRSKRDFTFIDDAVECVWRILHRPAGDAGGVPFDLFNVGSGRVITTLEIVAALEQELGIPAAREFLPAQEGDMDATLADAEELRLRIGFRPATAFQDGVRQFVDWYRERESLLQTGV